MTLRCLGLVGLLLAIEAGWASASTNLFPLRRAEPAGKDLPLDRFSDKHRKLAQHVLAKPAFSAKGPSEAFYCNPQHYLYFLDHPDKAVAAWRRLGAKCVSISCKGDQQFGWTDPLGSEVTWETVHRGGEMRIWYADGKVKPNNVMPLIPVKALLVIRHKALQKPDGATLVQHQADLYVHTDSKTAALVARMLGPSAHRVAEQGLGQLQLFFSGLSWYLDRHPDQAETLLREEPVVSETEKKQ
jgi:hypothetical protein